MVKIEMIEQCRPWKIEKKLSLKRKRKEQGNVVNKRKPPLGGN
jgi:hypothetical protein